MISGVCEEHRKGWIGRAKELSGEIKTPVKATGVKFIVFEIKS